MLLNMKKGRDAEDLVIYIWADDEEIVPKPKRESELIAKCSSHKCIALFFYCKIKVHIS